MPFVCEVFFANSSLFFFVDVPDEIEVDDTSTTLQFVKSQKKNIGFFEEDPQYYSGERPDCLIIVTHLDKDLDDEVILQLFGDVGKPVIYHRHKYNHVHHHHSMMVGFTDPAFVIRAYKQLNGYNFYGNRYFLFFC